MQLKVDIEKIDGVRCRVAVEVPAETVTAEVERAYSELARSVNVPGFRKGRVPRHVLERMFRDRVRGQVLERLVRDSFVEAVEERQLPVVGAPEFETESADLQDGLRYHATVEVRPDVVAQGYHGLEVARPVHVVSQEQVDAVLENMRQSHARLHPVADRAVVEPGDVVTLTYEATLDGKLLGRGKNREVELGHNGFPEGFDAEILGANTGDLREFTLMYPDPYPNQELAGKSVQFAVTIEGLSTKEVPALDDDFAKTHGDAETLEELLARVRERLQQEADRTANEIVQRRLLDKLVEGNDFVVPNSMVAHRLESMVDEVWEEWQSRRVQPRNEAAAKEQLRVDLEPRAREQVKLALLLDAISQQEKLEVTDAELDERIEGIVQHSGAMSERMRAYYAAPRAREHLRVSMLHSRAVDHIVQGARIHDEPAESQIADAGQNR